MAVSPNTVRSFLDRSAPSLPDFKGMSDSSLHTHIHRATGVRFDSKTVPYHHQLAGVAAGLRAQRILWHYEMRTGKTKMALDWAEHLRKCASFQRKGLVIVPFPLAVGVFVEDAATHSRLRVQGVGNNLDDLVEVLESDTDLVVISWYGLQAIFTKRNPDPRQKGLVVDHHALTVAAEYFDLCIIDEIHTCNNTKSLRFNIANILTRGIVYRAGMTGTPLGRHKFDIWAQTFLIDDGATLGTNEYFFQQAFGKRVKEFFSPSGFKTVFDDNKSEILMRKLSSISISCALAEVRDVNVMSGVVKLELLAEQRKYYRDLINQIIRQDRAEHVEVQNTFMKLRQISSGFLPFTDNDGGDHVIHFKSSKMEWLAEFLENIPPDVVLVIYYEFTESGRAISDLLTKLKFKYGWLWGGNKDPDKSLREFQQGKFNVLVANTRSAWGAVNLQRADYQLFYESTVSPILRKQVEFRALGPARGNRPLFIDDLVSSTTERRILEFVREGKDVMNEVVFSRETWKSLLL